MTRTKELTDIHPDELEKVVDDYESEGAKVEKIKQDDGNRTVSVSFSEGEAHVDCCSHGVNDEEAIPDEDLPVAVGGVE